MKPQCRQAVERAAGRTLTQAEIKKIEDRISGTMRNLARTDPAGWRAKGADQRVLDAATQAMADIQAEAALKVTRAGMQIIKTAAMESRVVDLMASYAEGRNKALVHEMDNTHSYIEGVKRETMGNLMDLLDAVNSKQGASAGRKTMMVLFDAENPQMSRDLATEIFENAAGSTGNALAKAGAKAWLESIEGMRQRFNAGGGDVGRLDYGYLPQPHDQGRVRGDASPAARDKWVQSIMPQLDRGRYLQEDGARLTDQQLAGVLERAWETIATGGLNKMEPGKFSGSGARANAGSETRQIHFKDAGAYLQYMGKYGGGSMYDAMLGHIGGLSRDIGLVERYGPNPAQQMRLQMDLAEKADTGVKRAFGLRPESYWDLLNGKTGMAENGNIAQVAQDLRNIQVFGKLAGAVISSVTDVGSYFVTTGFNKLPYWEALKNIGKQLDGDTRDFLTMHGVIAETMVSNLNRWSGDNIKNTWSGRLANSTMKLSLMNAWTDTLRRSFAMTMMGGLAKMSKTEWAALTEWDRSHLGRKGITADDWDVIRAGQLTQFNGADFLTPEAIRASADPRAGEVVAKMLGLITDESEYAVINPDLATRAMASGGGLSRGTVRGELARSVMQFKSFPIAMISRHWRRMMEAPQGLDGAPVLGNRLMYGAAMMTSLTALGAVAFQTKQLVQGKDPVDMTTPKFWTRALAQGGGMGIVGDFIFTDPTENPGDATANAIKNVAGPTVGSAFDIGYKLGVENIYEAAKGKDMHLAAESIRVGRSHLPYVNLWFAKAAIDHAGLHALQENLSPGYLGRMQQRARRDWDQDYFWAPGSGGPDRAPDLTAVGGK
ncbi:hypothetical protein [Janthinobacterium sp. CG_S6]|uniref:hypothetical protein n=1 Tax=Janthinobacterium sp. CG_S6 TaxID=3071707 RepID=UPI002E002318|nr:hypothetical protein [Janthinobacterium sp. CG_S6]